jgi:hypothetical protein
MHVTRIQRLDLVLCNFFLVLVFGVCMVSLTSFAQAHTCPEWQDCGDLASLEEGATPFREELLLKDIQVPVPTVVEVPLTHIMYERTNVAVYEVDTKTFKPHYVRVTNIEKPVSVDVFIDDTRVSLLNDGYTHEGIDLPFQEGLNTATLSFYADQSIESSGIIFDFDTHVVIPRTIRIVASHEGEDTVVVAERSFDGDVIQFPHIVAQLWHVTLTYTQPIRLNEVRLIQDKVLSTQYRAVRFLAQPDYSYRIFHDADRATTIAVGEAGNLSADAGVVAYGVFVSTANPLYKQADSDSDGTPDIRDNCVLVSNTDQQDLDQNGIGDICDDFDRDGVRGYVDNCPNEPNANQKDTDADGVGDVCDATENRLTEKYPWIPWAGIGIAVLVLCVLFLLVATTPKRNEESINV